jgi:transcriptional regulator with XRE-family HTH domain
MRSLRYELHLRRVSKRPTGTYTPISRIWQDRVRSELKRRGWNQGDLASRLKCSGAAISLLLAEGARSSRMVDQINLVLDIAAPTYDDDIDQRSHLALKRLRKQNRALYDKIIEDAERELRSVATPDDDAEPK